MTTERKTTPSDQFHGWLIICLFIGAVLWGAIYAFFARVFVDEGWYLNTTRELLHGRWPYLDFFYPQGPASVLVHLPVMLLVPGIIAGRVQSLLLFIGSLWLGLSILRRDDRFVGALWWLALVGYHAMLVNMCTLVISAPYELFSILLALWLIQRRRYPYAMIVLAVVTCMRVSMVVPAFFFWLFCVLSTVKGERARAVMRLSVSALLPVLLLIGPYLLRAPAQLLDGLLFYHMWGGRHSFTAEQAWNHRVQFLLDFVRVYWPAAALAVFAWWRSRSRPWDRTELLFLGTAAAMTIVHALPALPDPRYHIVPVSLIALFAARRMTEKALPRWVIVMILLAIIPWEAASYTMRWDQFGPDLRSPRNFRRIARQIGDLAPGEPVLTFEPALAIEGGFTLPRGYELGTFSLTPLTDRRRVERDLLLTPERLLNDLRETRFAVLAVYQEDLGNLPIDLRQKATEALNRGYRYVAMFPKIGSLGETLFVFVQQASVDSSIGIPPDQ